MYEEMWRSTYVKANSTTKSIQGLVQNSSMLI